MRGKVKFIAVLPIVVVMMGVGRDVIQPSLLTLGTHLPSISNPLIQVADRGVVGSAESGIVGNDPSYRQILLSRSNRNAGNVRWHEDQPSLGWYIGRKNLPWPLKGEGPLVKYCGERRSPVRRVKNRILRANVTHIANGYFENTEQLMVRLKGNQIGAILKSELFPSDTKGALSSFSCLASGFCGGDRSSSGPIGFLQLQHRKEYSGSQSEESGQRYDYAHAGEDRYGDLSPISFWPLFLYFAAHLYVYGLVNLLAYWLIDSAVCVKSIGLLSIAKIALSAAVVVFSIAIPVHAWLYIIKRILGAI